MTDPADRVPAEEEPPRGLPPADALPSTPPAPEASPPPSLPGYAPTPAVSPPTFAPSPPTSAPSAPAPTPVAAESVSTRQPDPPPPDRRTGEPLLAAPARWLAAKGAGPSVLAGVAIGLAVVATFALVVDHPGLAGLLGLLTVLVGEVARQPAESAATADPRAPAFVLLADLTLGASLVLAGAAAENTILVLLGLAVVGVLAWLPYLKALGRPTRIAARTGLWRRAERLGVLMVGLLLGHPVIAQLLVLIVGVFDAWVRIVRLAPSGAPHRTPPPFLTPLLDADGALQPLVRWGSLALAVLLLLVLPRPDGWRF